MAGCEPEDAMGTSRADAAGHRRPPGPRLRFALPRLAGLGNIRLIRWFRDIPISKKLYFTVGTMAMLIAVELVSLFFCLNILSAVRGYVGGEGLWSKAQKDAVFHLYKYGASRDPEDYRLFWQFMKVPAGDGEARRELLKPHPDMQVVRQELLIGRNSPDDIDGMAWLFRTFGRTFYIGKAIAIWTEAEPIARQLMATAEDLHKEISSPAPSQAHIDTLLASIGPVNERLTKMEDAFSYTLGEGSRWLEGLVRRLLFSVALTVEMTGLLLTVSVSRSVQRGLGEVIRAAADFARGNYTARAKAYSRDEIGLLADAFNTMAARLEHGIVALRGEIAERERAEGELRQAFALLDQHVNNTPLAVIEWEQDLAAKGPPRVHRWSGRAETIFGWAESEVIGLASREFGLIHEGDVDRAVMAKRDLLHSGCAYNSLSLRCYTRDRQVRHCQWYNSALHPKGHGKITILSLVKDVSEQVAAVEDVYRLAHHDTLTGLPNRVLLQDRLQQALGKAWRSGRGVAVMMLDLDHFKNINDTLGHTIGDELLREVAARLGGRLRASDTIARLGGDEFILILLDATDRTSLGLVAQKLLDAFAEPFMIRDNRLDIGASIGITVFPDDATDPGGLLRNADIALYRAKRDGRGQYRCYSAEMAMEIKTNQELENGLRQALERDALELFYQPTVSLRDRRIRGIEALARWRRPDGVYVAPASFIPVAETTGLLLPLGEWALRTACDQARSWASAGRRVRMAVNISPVQLRQPDFAGMVERALDRSGLPAPFLELEVTEGVFLDPSKAAIARTLHKVADMGVHLAIDDFGTGFSSLGYLKDLPFDRIKIDRSFVHDIGVGANADAIVKAIITLARGLGKSVTAEGVETELQLAFLRRNDCDEAQGYLLGRPQSAAEIEAAFAADLGFDVPAPVPSTA